MSVLVIENSKESGIDICRAHGIAFDGPDLQSMRVLTKEFDLKSEVGETGVRANELTICGRRALRRLGSTGRPRTRGWCTRGTAKMPSGRLPENLGKEFGVAMPLHLPGLCQDKYKYISPRKAE
jgi:hypothetical protein